MSPLVTTALATLSLNTTGNWPSTPTSGIGHKFGSSPVNTTAGENIVLSPEVINAFSHIPVEEHPTVTIEPTTSVSKFNERDVPSPSGKPVGQNEPDEEMRLRAARCLSLASGSFIESLLLDIASGSLSESLVADKALESKVMSDCMAGFAPATHSGNNTRPLQGRGNGRFPIIKPSLDPDVGVDPQLEAAIFSLADSLGGILRANTAAEDRAKESASLKGVGRRYVEIDTFNSTTNGTSKIEQQQRIPHGATLLASKVRNGSDPERDLGMISSNLITGQTTTGQATTGPKKLDVAICPDLWCPSWGCKYFFCTRGEPLPNSISSKKLEVSSQPMDSPSFNGSSPKTHHIPHILEASTGPEKAKKCYGRWCPDYDGYISRAPGSHNSKPNLDRISNITANNIGPKKLDVAICPDLWCPNWGCKYFFCTRGEPLPAPKPKSSYGSQRTSSTIDPVSTVEVMPEGVGSLPTPKPNPTVEVMPELVVGTLPAPRP